MKKLIIALLLPTLFISSCSLFQKREEIPPPTQEETKLERLTGIISTPEDQDIGSSLIAFVLVMDSGSRVFVDSLSTNLKKYKRRRVEVEGKWNTDKTMFDIENLTPIGNETQVKKTYENAELGLKFQYPELWFLQEKKEPSQMVYVAITPYEVAEDESVDRITIERFENNRRLSAKEYLQLDDNYVKLNESQDNAVYQEAAIGALQLTAIKRTSSKEINFYVGRDSFIYRFTHKTIDDSDKDQYSNAFFDLVQSFEFIPFGELRPPPVVSGTSTPSAKKPVESPKTTEAVTTPQCSATKPCFGDFICEEGKCIGVADCFRDTDCGQGQRCYKGSCEASLEIKISAKGRQAFIDYIKTNIATLAKEPSASGAWTVLSFEFAFPEGESKNFNAIYVVYSDGTEKRKILLTVPNQSKPESMILSAYFKPGETTDWQLAEGTDTAKKSERSFVAASGGQEIVVKSGMTLLDAKSYKIKIQYPAKWYWAYREGGYSFSDKPISDISQSFFPRLLKNPEALPAEMASIGTIGSFKATQGEMAELLSICIEGSNAKYCLSGAPEYAETMKQMFETLQE